MIKIIVVTDQSRSNAHHRSDVHVGSGSLRNAGIEFNAARYGVNIEAYATAHPDECVAAGIAPRTIPFEDIAHQNIDAVVLATPDDSSLRQRLIEFGVPPERIFSYARDFQDIIRTFERSRAVTTRDHVIREGCLVSTARTWPLSTKITDDIPCSTGEAIRLAVTSEIFTAYLSSLTDVRRNHPDYHPGNT